MIVKGISVSLGTPVEVECEGDHILRITPLQNSYEKLPYLSAGFLDMQVNGYFGSDYSNPGFSDDDIKRIIASLAASGTTQHIPTIVSSPNDRVLRNLQILAKARKTDPDVRAAIAGIHIEGPYISDEDGPRGVHDRNYIRDPDYKEFEDWQSAAEGSIRIVTVAPERKGAIPFIEKISENGVIPAIGHTGADPETIAKAVSAGARLSTHLGNGSYTSLPRLQNYIWEQLASDALTAGMISDGFHLPASVVKVFYRVKGPDNVVLVSDAALLGGKSPGIYKWGTVDVQVFPDGHLGMPGTSILAGAAHLLDWDIPRFMEFTGASLYETIRLCTVNPGRLLKLESGYGELSLGSPANLILFNRDSQGALAIEKTIRGGRPVFEKSI